MNLVDTMESWPKKIDNYNDLPEIFEISFKALMYDTDAFPYTVFIPSNPFNPRKSKPKLISILNDKVYILEKLRREVKSICYPFKSITYVETASILLNSWLRIHGVLNGESTSTTIEFNTTRKDLFIPIIKTIRSSINEFDHGDIGYEIAKLNYLKAISLKFLNYSKRSIMQGEKISNIVYQPEMWTKFLKHFNRRLSPSHITILTDKELIIIKEYNNLKNSKDCSYGGVWSYIPLHRIKFISLEDTENKDIINLVVNFKNDNNITISFSLSNKSDLDSLIEGFLKLSRLYSA
ncbi:hypothetical protein R9X47_16600 [Wukongibacter baidiensis]|uniref:hypothetical protein n=1 Tax=Wukongibacter baidiensis TaxID=1723361 RepID=UPI003D7FC76C